MSDTNSDLKYPVGIYALSVVFLLAPLGNIIGSFAGSGIPDWYKPSVFLSLLQTVPAVDWLWLSGIFIAGIALLLRHKMAWMIAVSVLLLVLVLNTYRAFTLDDALMTTDFVRMQILVSILVTFSVLIISFYARYPYLDRRQQWLLPTAHRFQKATPVTVHFGESSEPGVTNSMSSAGARIVFPRTMEALKKASTVDVTFTEWSDEKILCQVIEYSGQGLRVKFKNFGWSQRSRLETWLRSRPG